MSQVMRGDGARPNMPADALWLFDGDLFIGNQRVVAKAETADGLGAALACAFARHRHGIKSTSPAS